jgi:hypothetical protein
MDNVNITKLKPYKGFTITRVETHHEWGVSKTYEAWREMHGSVKDYICDCSTLKNCKYEIDCILLDIEQ